MAASLIRVPRPGASTATTSTVSLNNSPQARNDTSPPPAKGKQNKRALASGLGRGATNHLPLLREAIAAAATTSDVSEFSVAGPLPRPPESGAFLYSPTPGRTSGGLPFSANPVEVSSLAQY